MIVYRNARRSQWATSPYQQTVRLVERWEYAQKFVYGYFYKTNVRPGFPCFVAEAIDRIHSVLQACAQDCIGQCPPKAVAAERYAPRYCKQTFAHLELCVNDVVGYGVVDAPYEKRGVSKRGSSLPVRQQKMNDWVLSGSRQTDMLRQRNFLQATSSDNQSLAMNWPICAACGTCRHSTSTGTTTNPRRAQ